MKADLEQDDIQAIAQAVFETLKPYLLHREDRTEDSIFDVPDLCEYLKVSPKWIHERTHLKEMPFIKLSNKQLRFRKRDIDKWLESLKTLPVNDFRGRVKIIK